MKNPEREFCVDRKKLSKFVTRINREAKKLFPDGDGDSLLDIKVRDITRYLQHQSSPIPRYDLMETQEEWRYAIRLAHSNMTTASEHLRLILSAYDDKERRKEALERITTKLAKMGKKTGRKILLSEGEKPSPGLGRKWTIMTGKWIEDNRHDVENAIIQFAEEACNFFNDKFLDSSLEDILIFRQNGTWYAYLAHDFCNDERG